MVDTKKRKGMITMYNFETFNNFSDLKATHPTLASELEKNVKDGSWKNEPIICYPDIEEYTLYELSEGWYVDSGLNYENNFNGAPNPLDYIDLSALGDALASSWDPSSCYLASNGSILQTTHGW